MQMLFCCFKADVAESSGFLAWRFYNYPRLFCVKVPMKKSEGRGDQVKCSVKLFLIMNNHHRGDIKISNPMRRITSALFGADQLREGKSHLIR